MNRRGRRPESLRKDQFAAAPEFVTAVGDDSISRFDEAKKKKHRNKGRRNGHRKGQGSGKQES